MSQEYIEVTERTVSEAITAACQKLAVPSDRLEYEVIDAGKTGFLGIGARAARIRVRVKKGMEESTEIDTSAIISDVLKGKNEKKKTYEQRPKETSREERKKNTSGPVKKETEKNKAAFDKKAAADKNAAEKSAFAEKNAAEKNAFTEKNAASYAGSTAAVQSPAAAEKEKQPEFAEMTAKKEETAEGTYSGRKNFGRRDSSEKNQERGSRERGRGHRRQRRFDREDTRTADREKNAPQQEVPFTPKKRSAVPNLTDEQIAEVKERAESFLKDVLQAMDLEAEVKSVYEKESGMLNIEINGENMGVLIGKRGQTLDSLQYLVSLVVNKGMEGYIHVKADTENYRERRRKTLENLAKNIAGKVKKNRSSVALEPMNPYERRIIHSALQGDRYVTTYSQGEEPYRKVIVTLKEDVIIHNR